MNFRIWIVLALVLAAAPVAHASESAAQKSDDRPPEGEQTRESDQVLGIGVRLDKPYWIMLDQPGGGSYSETVMGNTFGSVIPSSQSQWVKGWNWLRLLVVNEEHSLMVSYIVPGSPAEKGGLRSNDRIVAVNGKPVKGFRRDDVIHFFRNGEAGAIILVTVERNQSGAGGNTHVLKVTHSIVRGQFMRGGDKEYGCPGTSSDLPVPSAGSKLSVVNTLGMGGCLL